MLNGHQNGSTSSLYYNNSLNNDTTVASLFNLGNTCYLNSVLYTLRYCPGFIRKLHHLVTNLKHMSSVNGQRKQKSSSLGRNVAPITGSNSRSNSSKDLLSLGNSKNDFIKPGYQVIVEELHELYVAMHSYEVRDSSEPFRPSSFMQAFVDRNKVFEGNRQQDAHEFLMCLLSAVRETCQIVVKKADEVIGSDLLNAPKIPEKPLAKESSKSWSIKSWKRSKTSSKDSDSENVPNETNKSNNSLTKPSKVGCETNFITQDFEGVSFVRMICCECECVTERKEVFTDICVPIDDTREYDTENSDQIFKSACVTSEQLTGQNKYFCDHCCRYNEARREVRFEKLPKILVIQLKRFMATSNGAEKTKNFMPTPLNLTCFCEMCCKYDRDHDPERKHLKRNSVDIKTSQNDKRFHDESVHRSEKRPHEYSLFSVIMHKGAFMAEGHYFSYIKDVNHCQDYLNCPYERDHNSILIQSNGPDKTGRISEFFKPRVVDSTNTSLVKNANIACKSLQCCSVNVNSSQRSQSLNKSSKDVWLECNDDIVQQMTARELQLLLEDKKKVTSTPYLLFYAETTRL